MARSCQGLCHEDRSTRTRLRRQVQRWAEGLVLGDGDISRGVSHYGNLYVVPRAPGPHTDVDLLLLSRHHGTHHARWLFYPSIRRYLRYPGNSAWNAAWNGHETVGLDASSGMVP